MDLSRALESRGSCRAETAVSVDLPRRSALSVVPWALLASTSHRIRRGEGALLAVNLSLIAYRATTVAHDLAAAAVSTLAILLMYAFNDLYDAPGDVNNPKKDPALIGVYLEHRNSAAAAILVFKIVTLFLSLVTLGTTPTLAVLGVMLVNIVYSTKLKGVPVVDVVWCGLWGALYAAIVSTSPVVLLWVGLTTAICHLYQALGDRVSDAANAIRTTAVRSPDLARNVLVALCAALFVAIFSTLGATWACTAFLPLAFFFLTPPHTGWLLSKVYFGVVWLYLLGSPLALG